MNLDSLLLMRNEIMLAMAALILLIVDLSIEKNKKSIISIATWLFAIVTVVGCLPQESGDLFGGMYVTSPMHWVMKNVLNIGTLIILLQSAKWLKNPANEIKISEFFIIIFCSVLGMQFMVSSGNFLMLYLGLELATIPVAALAAYDRYRSKSAEAGIKLILSSAMSSAVLLFGISLIYGVSGSTEYKTVQEAFNVASKNEPLFILAFIFFFSGMAFKLSLVPFHLWTADVYEGSPVSVTSYLSVISKGASAFIVVILLFTVFKEIKDSWKPLLYVLSVLTMTIGNLFAIRQQNLKRFFAFSSIAQAGFILLGMLGANQLGMASVIYFVFIYIFSNLGVFGVISTIYNYSSKENLDDYNGLYLTNPKLSWVMTLSLFSLAGIPPVAGFFGKFFLFTAAASSGYYWLVFIAVLNATISLYYYLLIVKAMFINKSETPIAKFRSDNSARLGLLICVIGVFIIGLASAIYQLAFDVSPVFVK